jgi:hypothetical protein
LAELTRGAGTNTDDNGLIEFAAPRALYLETQDDNIEMLEGKAADPMSGVAALARTTESPDTFRLEIIRRWIWRKDQRRAAEAVAFFADAGLKAHADRLLATASPATD